MAKYEKRINITDTMEDMQKLNIITEIQKMEIISILNMSDPEDLTGKDIRLYHDVITNIKFSALKKTKSLKKETRNLIYETFEKISKLSKLQFIRSIITLRCEFAECLIKNENLNIEGSYKGTHGIILKNIFDILIKYPVEKIISIVEIQPDNYLSTIMEIFKVILDQIESTIGNGGIYLTDTFKNNLKNDLQQRYPTVGRNKLSILESPEKLNKDYLDYVKKIMLAKIEAYIQINFSNYKIFGDCIHESSFYLNYLLEDNNQEVYEEFVTQYMHDLFLKTTNKKVNCSQPKRNQTVVSGNNTIIESKDMRIKVCPNQINEFLNNYLNIIKTDTKTRMEIRNYILRIYLNKKSIRIKDLIQKFPITKDLFTEDFVNEAKLIGIIFENGNGKSNEKKIVVNDISIPESINELEIQIDNKTKLAFDNKIDSFLDNIKDFDGNGFIELIKLAGYKTENDKYLAKTFDKLYKRDCNMKLLFLNNIKKNIYSQEKISHVKKWYRKINLHDYYRILFLIDNKTIDGIYNHTDYENRIDGRIF